MRIDKHLNLVVPVYDDDGKTVVAYAHSTPLAAEFVDRHFLLLAQTFAAVFNQGLGRAAGPAVAMRLLRQIAVNTKSWDNADGSQGDAQALVAEIRRLTTVLVPADGGWQQVPLEVAVDRKVLSAEDRAEVENAVVFFIASYATLPRNQRREMLEAAVELWGAQLTSSTATDFVSSLKTSTAAVNTGAKSPAPVPIPPTLPSHYCVISSVSPIAVIRRCSRRSSHRGVSISSFPRTIFAGCVPRLPRK